MTFPTSVSLMEQISPDLTETDSCRSLCWKTWQSEFKDNLWHEICSEFDARRLAEHVRSAQLPLSDQFRRFQERWLQDENSHYLGFRRLYSTMYGVAADEVAARVEARPSAFAGLAPFLVDEFHLCVLLAYDEIVTARAYATDFAIYDALGEPHLSAWIRQVCREESNHFRGAVQILKSRHVSRLDAVPRALGELVGYNAGAAEYGGSFVLDHQSYPQALIDRGLQAVMTLCRASADKT